MKRTQLLLTGLMCSVVACTSNTNSQYNRGNKGSTISGADAYLLDMADAAATAEDTDTAQVGVSVGDDLDDARLNERATRMLEIADVDKSGSLSLEEFLAGPQKLRQEHEREIDFKPSDAQLEKMKARLSADFEEFAGEDSLLSKDELVALLVQKAPIISHHRDHGRGNHREDGDRPERGPNGGHGPKKPPLAWDQIVAKYDKNGDGQLSKDEFEAFRSDRHPKREGHQ